MRTKQWNHSPPPKRNMRICSYDTGALTDQTWMPRILSTTKAMSFSSRHHVKISNQHLARTQGFSEPLQAEGELLSLCVCKSLLLVVSVQLIQAHFGAMLVGAVFSNFAQSAYLYINCPRQRFRNAMRSVYTSAPRELPCFASPARTDTDKGSNRLPELDH